MQSTLPAFSLRCLLDADLRHDQMAAVALHLVVRQLRKLTVRQRSA
jgi:hypothetical protein